MEFIENRFGLFLPYSSSFIRGQLGDFPLDLVELLDGDQCLFCNLTLIVGMQIEEFAARMGHATRFGDTVGDQGFVAGVIVANERTAPIPPASE